jgi:CO/xanthine dehydrogenase FAD-binding subunit
MKARATDYELVSPATLAGVLALMASEPGQWTPIAGGTELMVQFGAGHLRARKLVNLFGLPELQGIAQTEHGVRIGAGTTYTSLRRSPIIAQSFPLLATAAAWTGSIANQNRGTLGGNLVNGSPAADSPPALLAYDAHLELVSQRGTRQITRRIAYADFHTGYKTNALAPDELVHAIHLPTHTANVQYLRKVGPRNAQAISKVALGAVASTQSGRLTGVRIGLASVSFAPFRCLNTEAFLEGLALGNQPANQLAAHRAARETLLAEIAPLDDIRSTGAYRAHVAANLLEEFLAQAAAPNSPQARP